MLNLSPPPRRSDWAESHHSRRCELKSSAGIPLLEKVGKKQLNCRNLTDFHPTIGLTATK